MTQLYKFTRSDGSPCHGGDGMWALPRNKQPGAWRTVEGDLVPCENGLHLCRPQDLLYWLGEALWEAEHDGEIIEANNKVVVRHARLLRRVDAWNDTTARLFAVHCAASVLPIYEKRHPNDSRVRYCILTARRFALGTATRAKMDAAREAAWEAAWGAAGDAVREAAGDAAGDAAWAAAGNAAREAAGAAAWGAAWEAAGNAAREAARDAAWAAARAWQSDLLVRALGNPTILHTLPKELQT